MNAKSRADVFLTSLHPPLAYKKLQPWNGKGWIIRVFFFDCKRYFNQKLKTHFDFFLDEKIWVLIYVKKNTENGFFLGGIEIYACVSYILYIKEQYASQTTLCDSGLFSRFSTHLRFVPRINKIIV